MKRILVASTILLLIIGCEPPKIEGDVFLVKGDGKPQPSAAKEVIFVKAESFEDILIKSYLESVQEEANMNAGLISDICNSGSAIIISEKEDIQDALNGRVAKGKANNVTDQDGSCTLIQKQFDEASSAATSSRNAFNTLIAQEEATIAQAEAELIKLRNLLENKIARKENSLYQNFSEGIGISLSGNLNRGRSKGGVITVANNTPYNIRLEGDLCLQFYNSEGDPVGTTYDGTLYECTYSPSKMYKGVQLISSDLDLNKSTDEYGFPRGGFLKKWQTIIQKFETNAFCSLGSYTASESLMMTRKYGGDKQKWPDLSMPDLSKGYTILKPSEYYDDNACRHGSGDDSKFIPLKDEVRIEDGNQIIYYSEPISFREIAEAEAYEERDLIKTQEGIIITAKNKIESITDQSIEDPLLANELDARSNLDQCSELTAKNEADQEQIAWMDVSLGQIQKCDLDDAGLFETLLNVGLLPADENRLGSILETDYSAKASYAALTRFADSEYMTTTNISGHYVMDGIPKGNYVVYSSYQDNFTEGIYLDNIEISGDAVIDLSNMKFHAVGSIDSVIRLFYEDCSDKICSESDLRYTLDIDKAERRYEKRKQDAKDLQETIRELERLLGN